MRRYMHPAALFGVYSMAGALPLFGLFWEHDSSAGVLRELGIATGLLALSLLLLQFVSSGRYAILSRAAGIDRTMRFHQLAALAVLALVLVHPILLLVASTGFDLQEMLTRMRAWLGAPHLRSGWFAWALLLAMVMAGIWRKRLPVPYEWWRGSHTLAALLLGLGGLHHALALGSYSNSVWLSAYWWALVALSFGTLAYLYLLKPFLLVRAAHRVVSNIEIGHGIREIVLEPAAGKPLKYDAGQFAWVLLDQPPITLLDHPFSFSSAPGATPELRLLIKARGDFTRNLHRIRAGARAYLDGPHGNFTLTGRHGRTIALIAGGIGIVAIISILRHLRTQKDMRPIAVLYGARNPKQLVHADEIRSAAAELDLQYRFFVDEPPSDWNGGIGELTESAVQEAVRGDPAECLCFVCGPTPMMLDCREYLRRYGLPTAQIVFERFDYD